MLAKVIEAMQFFISSLNVGESAVSLTETCSNYWHFENFVIVTCSCAEYIIDFLQDMPGLSAVPKCLNRAAFPSYCVWQHCYLKHSSAEMILLMLVHKQHQEKDPRVQTEEF